MRIFNQAHYKVLQTLPLCDFPCQAVALHCSHMSSYSHLLMKAPQMNSLIGSISISLLSLISMETAFASSGFEMEFGPAQYAGDPSGQGSAARARGQEYGSAAWEGQEGVSPVTYKEWISAGPQKSEEGRLSPEQRRLLRHEINEAGRELYREK